jgi:hypothetical protein
MQTTMEGFTARTTGTAYGTLHSMEVKTLDDIRESQACAEELFKDIKVFEDAKKVAVKNRYPRTKLHEYVNLNSIVLQKCREKRIAREKQQ